jgi:hypothetical protein
MRRHFAALAMVLALAGAALAEVIYEALKPIVDAPTANLASPLTVADTGSFVTATRPRLTHGNSKIVVVPTFSTAGATATIEIIGYHRLGSTTTFGTLLLSQPVVASSTLNSNATRYVITDGYILAPTLGLQVYDVRLRSISGGDVTWTSWTLGHDSITAGATNE